MFLSYDFVDILDEFDLFFRFHLSVFRIIGKKGNILSSGWKIGILLLFRLFSLRLINFVFSKEER